MSTVMYGPSIQEAIASGSLARMKRIARLAEKKLKEEGDIGAALQVLRIEIARMEANVRAPRTKRRRH